MFLECPWNYLSAEGERGRSLSNWTVEVTILVLGLISPFTSVTSPLPSPLKPSRHPATPDSHTGIQPFPGLSLY